MPFTKPLPEWDAAGVEPPASTKQNGYQAGDKPPADWFNWFFNLVYQALQELQQNGFTQSEITQAITSAVTAAATTAQNNLTAHTNRSDNPHSVTKAQVGLDQVNNTSDANKPVSTAQAAADTTTYNNAINWAKGFGLGSTLNGSATDFNALDATGFYQLSGTAQNAPHSTSGTWNVINLKNSNSGYMTQYANYNNGSGAQVESFYFRTCTTGTWSSWKRMAGVDDNVASATKLQTARTLSLTGDGTASGSFDGSANLALALVLAASGVTAGTYKSVTVDSKGRVTGGTNPTTLAGYGITDALPASSYTASDILTKLLTVDGTDSGLNADLLQGINGAKFPIKTTSDIDYYVSTAGDDSNDGLTNETAFRTLAKAIAMIPDVLVHSVNINLAPGTYNEILAIRNKAGGGNLSITGAGIDSSIINGGLLVVQCTSKFGSNGITFKRTSAAASTIPELDVGALKMASCTSFDISSCKFDGNNLNQRGFSAYDSKGILRAPTFVNSDYAVHADNNATVHIDCTGSIASSNNGVGLVAGRGSVITKGGGIMPAATTAELVLSGGEIRDYIHSLSGGGYQKLPGGLILQWGAMSVNSGTVTQANFPISFPNSCAQCFATMDSNAAGSGLGVSVYSYLSSSVNLFHTQGTQRLIHWLAIGY